MPNLSPALLVLTAVFALAIGWYSTSHTTTTSNSLTDVSLRGTPPSYQAPFGNPTVSPTDIRKSYYIIYLAPGHEIKDVSHAIGIDIEPLVDVVLRQGPDSAIALRVKGDDSLFEAIRSDPGVIMVDYDARIYPADEI